MSVQREEALVEIEAAAHPKLQLVTDDRERDGDTLGDIVRGVVEDLEHILAESIAPGAADGTLARCAALAVAELAPRRPELDAHLRGSEPIEREEDGRVRRSPQDQRLLTIGTRGRDGYSLVARGGLVGGERRRRRATTGEQQPQRGKGRAGHR